MLSNLSSRSVLNDIAAPGGILTTMPNSATVVCLLALLAFSVDAQRSNLVSVGTFNALLIPGSTAIEERKALLLQTVSELCAIWLHCMLSYPSTYVATTRSTSNYSVNTLVIACSYGTVVLIFLQLPSS